jgi:hypothetical protein
VQPGEALHEEGREGARRAKRWLESTTRVKSVWLNTDGMHASRMTFSWPVKGSYSYDVAGIMLGAEFEGHSFAAECKSYHARRQPGHGLPLILGEMLFYRPSVQRLL